MVLPEGLHVAITHSNDVKGATFAGQLNAGKSHVHMLMGTILILLPVWCCIMSFFCAEGSLPSSPEQLHPGSSQLHTLFCSVPIVLPFYHSGIGAVLPNKHMLPGVGEFQLAAPAGLLPAGMTRSHQSSWTLMLIAPSSKPAVG